MSLGPVSAHQELRPGKLVVSCARERGRSLQLQHATARRPCSLAPLLARAAGQPGPGTEDAGHGRCSAVAAARCSAGEHRTATVLDYRLRLYTEVSTLCCSVTRATLGGNLREAGGGADSKRDREREREEKRKERRLAMQSRRGLKATEMTRMERREATVPLPAQSSPNLDFDNSHCAAKDGALISTSITRSLPTLALTRVQQILAWPGPACLPIYSPV